MTSAGTRDWNPALCIQFSCALQNGSCSKPHGKQPRSANPLGICTGLRRTVCGSRGVTGFFVPPAACRARHLAGRKVNVRDPQMGVGIVACRSSAHPIRQPGLGQRHAARTGRHRRRLGGIVLGPWMYDRPFQALRSTWIESVARKTLGREACRGSGIGNRHCSCRDRLCVRSRAQVVLSLPSLGLGANAMVGGHDWDTGSDFHRYRSGPLAEKKIDGRRHSVVGGHASRALHRSRRDSREWPVRKTFQSTLTLEEGFMVLDPPAGASFRCSVAPWLSVRNSARAVDFYKSAFGATEVYRLDGPEGSVVARLSVDGAEFWLSDESPEHGNLSPESLGGGSVRMILTVADPDAVFVQALAAGASRVYSVSEGHGWRVGRVLDPFGHHWEIARPLAA